MGSFVPATSASLAKRHVSLFGRPRPVGGNTNCFCAHLNIFALLMRVLKGEIYGKVVDPRAGTQSCR